MSLHELRCNWLTPESCDGNQPKCRGCVRKGKDCTYEVIRAGDTTSEEVSNMLKTLNERLGAFGL